jgi:hypothetical protein
MLPRISDPMCWINIRHVYPIFKHVILFNNISCGCISDYFNFFLSIWSFRFWCSFLLVCLFVYFCFCFLFSGFFCGFFLFFFISFFNLFFFVFCLFCFYVVFVLGISAVLLYLLCGDLVKDYIQSYFSIVALLILHLLHQGKEIKYIYKRPTLKLKENENFKLKEKNWNNQRYITHFCPDINSFFYICG